MIRNLVKKAKKNRKISNQFRTILFCLQDSDLDIFGKGAGWDNEEACTWLDPGDLESSHKKGKKSRKISHQEARETVAILKTMNSICMSNELDELGCRQYEMRCDLR